MNAIFDAQQLIGNQRRAIARALRAASGAQASEILAKTPSVPTILDVSLDDLSDRLNCVSRKFESAVLLAPPLALVKNSILEKCQIGTVSHVARFAAPDYRPDVVLEGESLDTDQKSSLVISLFEMQWINRLPEYLGAIRNHLLPDGLFLGCIIGGNSLQELRTSLHQAETRIGIQPQQHIMPNVDIKSAGNLLSRTGFRLTVVDKENFTFHYRDLNELYQDLRAWGARNCLVSRAQTRLSRRCLQETEDFYAEHFSSADGRLIASFEVIWMLGWRYHESQPRPLKPGSATHSLAKLLDKSNEA